MKFSSLLSIFGFTSYVVNPTMLTTKTKGGLVILSAYMDAILLTSSDDTSIYANKTHLQLHINSCDLRSSRYFLGIEFPHQDRKVSFDLPEVCP